jgi:hypothetical protein
LYEITGTFALYLVSGCIALAGGMVFKGYQVTVKKEII